MSIPRTHTPTTVAAERPEYPEWVRSQPRLRVAVLIAPTYAVAVAASLLMAQISLDVSTIWLASGVGVISVLIWGYWLLPVLLAIQIPVGLAVSGGSAVGVVLGMSVVATAEIGLAAGLLRRSSSDAPLTFDLAGTARFAWVCVLLVPVIGAIAATAWVWLIGAIRAEDWFLIARNWWLSVVFGILCVVPSVNNWLAFGTPRFHGARREAVAVLFALMATSGLILVYQLSQHNPVEAVLYASLPILLWASVFLRETGAATALSATTVFALGANHFVSADAIPIWGLGAHILAFGLMSLIIANGQTRLEGVISERARAADLELLAYRDTLTGLANRNRVLELLKGRPHEGAVAILMMDLDGFKAINDRYGHAVGDEVLRVIGVRLSNSYKEGDLVARMGGDEFIVRLSGCPDQQTASRVAERLMDEISKPVTIEVPEHGAITVEVGVSVGIAWSREQVADTAALMKHADAALYEAKAAGKRRAVASRDV